MWKAQYDLRKALGEDLRRKIIEDIIGKGGDFTIGFLLGNVSVIAREKRVQF